MNIGELWATLGIDSTGLEHSIVAMRAWERKANASMLKVQRGLDQTSARFGAIRRGMMTGLILPMAAVGIGAFKMYKDFEFNMNKVVSLVGVARKQVDAWSKDILALAPKVGKGPVQLADAMYFITSAGIRGAEALDILKESARSSAGGLGEVKVVADLLTSTMNAYGKENLTAAHANDILVATVREGKAEANLLAQSLGLVLPIASAMGATFDQVGAATAAMTRTGTKAATAAIQLRQIFNSLLKPAKEAEQALIDMHTSSAELRRVIREKGLMAALVELKKLTEEYGIAALGKVIPNIRSLTGVLDIVGKNFESNVKLTEAIKNSYGDANKMFEETAHTVEFRLNAAVARAQSSMVKFGESVSAGVIPIIERLSMRIEKIVDRFDALSDTEKTARIQTGLLVGKLFIAIFVVEKLTKAASNLIFVFRGLLAWTAKIQWPAMATAIGKVATVLKGVSTAALGVGSAFAAILGVGTIYGRRIEKGLIKEAELRRAGIMLLGDELKAYKKLNDVQRELELRRLTEIDHQKQLNEQYGIYIKLLESSETIAVEALSLPGMNITQLEDFKNKTTGALEEIQGYIKELSKTEEIEIPVGLAAMDPRKLVGYFTTQAKMIESALIEGASGQDLYTAYQGTFKDIGGVIEEEMTKSSSNMSDAFSNNAMAMGATVGILADTIVNAFSTGAWVENPAEGFFGDQAKSAEKASELMILIAEDTKNKEKEILEKRLDTYRTIIQLINDETKKLEEEARAKRKSQEESGIAIELNRQLKAIATLGKLVYNELEVAEAQVNSFKTAIVALAELGIGPTDNRMKRWTNSLIQAQKEVDRLDQDVTDLSESMEDLQKTLAISAYKGSILPEFDINQANLKAYESYFNDLVARQAELGRAAMSSENDLTELQKSIEHLTWNPEGVLQGQDFKTEAMKVNEAIQSVMKEMERLSQLAGKNTGLQLGKALGDNVAEIGAANLAPLEHAKAMLKTFQDAKVAAADSQMAGQELTNFTTMLDEEIDNWSAIVEKMTFWDELYKGAKVAAREIAGLFSDLGNLWGTQMQNEVMAMENSVKARGKSEKWLAQEREKIQSKYRKKMQVAAISEAIINQALAIVGVWKAYAPIPGGNIISAILTGVIAAATGVQIATIRAQKMAEGGIVPPGYPKDTYPALLTSGEKVIPARASRQEQISGEVVFRIEGTELVGVLKKQMSLDSNY